MYRSESNILVFISSVMTDELEWAREEVVRTLETIPFAQPWAFECTPASSETPDDAYLRKARDADFMVWLVGSRTTQPVVREVNTRMAAGRRLLVFQLPARSRDADTRQLLLTVSTYCKWQSVTSATSLSEALTASISDEIARVLRDPAAPVRQRTLQQWLDSSIAKCKQSWIALGVPDELATELANNRSIGQVLTAPAPGFQLVTGPAGSGKSLAASRLFQEAIDSALADANQPFPLFVAARDLHGPLEEYIERRTAGLVQLPDQPTVIILDGLDERGVLEGNELLTQIQYYADAYPRSRVLATSRALPGLGLPEPHAPISSMSDTEATALIARIANRPVELPELHGWSDSVRTAAARPLFAVMIGVELRRSANMRLHRSVELLDRLARQVVESAPAGGRHLDSLLQRLAVSAINTGSRVRKADLTPHHADQRHVADSRLVDESGDTLDFTHEVLREWFAARAIIEEAVSLDDLIPASDRWIASFQLVVESDYSNTGHALLRQLASSDPGMAGLVMPERRSDHDEAEVYGPTGSAVQVGRQLWEAMDAWRQGMGDLFGAIGPADANGNTAGLGIRMSSTTVTTSWYTGDRTLPQRVVPLPEPSERGPDSLDPGWVVLHTESAPRGLEWPWIATRRHLTESLSRVVITRRLALPSDDAVRELVWAFALAVNNQGEFSPRPIATNTVLEVARRLTAGARPGDVFVVQRLEMTLDELVLVERRLEQMREEGDGTVRDPWPLFDRRPSPDTRTCSTWDFYSDDRLLERATAVYSAGLRLYMEMVDRWFSSFRRRFRFIGLFPILLEGRLTKSHQPRFEGAPGLTWRARALPMGETSRVALEWGPADDFHSLSYWRDEEDNLRSVRPGTDATPYPVVGGSLPSIGTVRPATDLAHSWLIRDLRELGWTDLSTASLR